jgi:CRP/FNR family transcriptional regulator, cyclic AMP receptor protein
MADVSSLADKLAAVDIFAHMNAKSRKELAKHLRVNDFAPGSDVVDEGELGVGFHLILEGDAEVHVGGRVVNKLHAGDHFGEISLVDGEPRSATVRAMTAMQTAGLSAWQFRTLVQKDAALIDGLLKGLCARLRAAEARGAQPTDE